MASMMTYTYDTNTVSDLHKEAFGFRPSAGFWQAWSQASDEERQAEWDSLLRALERTSAAQAEAQAEAIKAFESLVTTTIQAGAGDRATALRWIMEADHNADGDWEILAYYHNLPFSYFRNKE